MNISYSWHFWNLLSRYQHFATQSIPLSSLGGFEWAYMRASSTSFKLFGTYFNQMSCLVLRGNRIIPNDINIDWFCFKQHLSKSQFLVLRMFWFIIWRLCELCLQFFDLLIGKWFVGCVCEHWFQNGFKKARHEKTLILRSACKILARMAWRAYEVAGDNFPRTMVKFVLIFSDEMEFRTAIYRSFRFKKSQIVFLHAMGKAFLVRFNVKILKSAFLNCLFLLKIKIDRPMCRESSQLLHHNLSIEFWQVSFNLHVNERFSNAVSSLTHFEFEFIRRDYFHYRSRSKPVFPSHIANLFYQKLVLNSVATIHLFYPPLQRRQKIFYFI